MQFLIYLDTKNERRRKLTATNNQRVAASSESFTTKANCENNAKLTLQGLYDYFYK